MPKTTDKRRSKYSAGASLDAREDTMGSSCLTIPPNCKFNQFKEAGEYVFDVIPFVIKKNKHPNREHLKPGMVSYQWTYWQHAGVGPDNKRIVCSEKQWNKKCPICEERRKIAQEPDHDEELAKSMNPKERTLMNLINRAKKSEGVVVDDRSFHLFEKQIKEELELQRNKHPEYDDFPSPTDGYALRVKVKMKKFAGHPFAEVSNVTFIERRTQYDEDIIEKAFALDTFPKELPYDKIKAMFGGDTDGDEDSGGEQVAVGDRVEFDHKGETVMAKVLTVNLKKGTAVLELDDEEILTMQIDDLQVVEKAGGKKAKDEDEEEEEEDEETEEEEEDEDEKPAKKGGKKKPAKDEDEEEEDEETEEDDEESEEEEEEEDEDDKPAKKPGKKPAGKKGGKK